MSSCRRTSPKRMRRTLNILALVSLGLCALTASCFGHDGSPVHGNQFLCNGQSEAETVIDARIGAVSLTNSTTLSGFSVTASSINGATSGNSTYTLGLTPSFSADVLAGNTVSFRMFAADTAVSYLSDSRSFGTASARPLLTITAVPEPTSRIFSSGGARGRPPP